MKQKRKLVPVELWQLGRVESWLNEQAQQGLQLVKLNEMYATFEKTAPQNGQYRMLVTREKDGTPTNVAELEVAGWDYVMSYHYYHVFYAQQPDASMAMLPDLATQAQSLSGILKKFKEQILIYSLLDLGFIALCFILLMSADTPIRNVIEGTIYGPLLIVLTYVVINIRLSRDYLALRRIQKQLEQGIAIDYQAKWRSGRVRKAAWNWGYVAFIVLMIFLLWQQGDNYDYQTLPENTEQLSLLRLHMIEQTDNLTRENLIADDVDWYNSIVQNGNILAPTRYKIRETLRVMEEQKATYAPELEYQFIECIVPSLAGALFKELTAYYDLENADFTSYGNFEQFVVQKLYGDWSRILTLKNKRVQYVDYQGQADIETILQALDNI